MTKSNSVSATNLAKMVYCPASVLDKTRPDNVSQNRMNAGVREHERISNLMRTKTEDAFLRTAKTRKTQLTQNVSGTQSGTHLTQNVSRDAFGGINTFSAVDAKDTFWGGVPVSQKTSFDRAQNKGPCQIFKARRKITFDRMKDSVDFPVFLVALVVGCAGAFLWEWLV